jgi:hypothetical protein
MKNYPKIKAVRPIGYKRLLITFSNDVKKIYDCSPLLEDDTFKPLLNDHFFRSVKADKHGYGISWTDDLDLSESELWLNGVMAEPQNSV